MIFELLLLLYPPKFRRRFGDDMRRFYREARRDEPAISLWPGLVIDTFIHATAAWVQLLTARSDRPYAHASFQERAMNGWLQELRQTIRTLLRNPGFALVTIFTLALGIGANTAIFTLVNALTLQSLPVERAEELYRLGDDDNCCVVTGLQNSFSLFSYPLYRDMQQAASEFSELAAFQPHPVDLTARQIGTSTVAEALRGELVTGNYFSMFGVRPDRGRLLTPADDQPGAPPVVVINYATWKTHFGSDPSVVGRALEINGVPATVLGVAAPDFFGDTIRPNPADFWIPLGAGSSLRISTVGLQQPNAHWLYVIGRLKSSALPVEAQAHLTAELQAWLTGAIPSRYRDRIAQQHITLSSARGGVAVLRLNYVAALRVLFAASGLVLLVACANIANLLLARVNVAHVAVRAAVGASRWRLARHSATEGTLLAVFGGLVGVIVAFVGTRALLVLAFPDARIVPIGAGPSPLVLGFAMSLSLATGLGFSIAPALIVSRANPADALHAAGRSPGDSSLISRRTFLIAQTALSLVLLVTAGLLSKSLRNLEHQSFGYQTDGLVMATIDPSLAGYRLSGLEHLYALVQQRLEQIPGVRSVGLSLYGPMSGDNWSSGIAIEGRALDPDHRDYISWNRVSGHYFQTTGTRLLRGRYINDADSSASPKATVINQSLAQKFFPASDPIQQHLGIGDAPHAGDYEIVGIVEDAKYQSAEGPASPMFFLPLLQHVVYSDPLNSSTQVRSSFARDIQLRVVGHPETLEASIRQALAEINPNLAVLNLATFDDRLRQNVGRERLIARLTVVYSALALALATLGLYGLTAYSVTRRRNEIGIRIALGAKQSGVIAFIIRGTVLNAACGVAIGVPLAYAAGRGLSHQLFGVSASDPLTLVSAAGLLIACAVAASWFPARRAATIDASMALRND